MKGFILTSFLIVAVESTLIEEHQVLFETFKVENEKRYNNHVEEVKRFTIFRENLLEIEQHNALYEQGLVPYQKGINQFTDMSQEEFKSYLGQHAKPIFNNSIAYELRDIEVPSSIDWRSKGHVTDVKNQGKCGACWAISLTGSTEAAYFRKRGTLVSLSDQQLVDCTKQINSGCVGGNVVPTFPYIEKYGLQAEASYKYTGKDGTCRYDSSKVVTKVNSHVSLRRSESKLLEVVGTIGPVSISINGDYLASYSGGVFSHKDCSPEGLNHDVLIVGYGTQNWWNKVNYWIVKNSWGPKWGENGYFKLLRGTNECGCAEDPAYPIIN